MSFLAEQAVRSLAEQAVRPLAEQTQTGTFWRQKVRVCVCSRKDVRWLFAEERKVPARGRTLGGAGGRAVEDTVEDVVEVDVVGHADPVAPPGNRSDQRHLVGVDHLFPVFAGKMHIG